MIALPFATDPNNRLNYRLLLNQYNETLRFNLFDKGVPNRGIKTNGEAINTDQFVVTLDYEQSVVQIAAEDRPPSGLGGGPGLAIHHEPGLWLHMLNETTDDLDLARLATVPHGDAALALGTAAQHDGPPKIPDANGLPIGVPQDLDHPYLEPYKFFHDNPFENLFDPVKPAALLEAANNGVNIKRTTVLPVDTTAGTGGIANIPFIVKQANAAEMQSTFWIQELEETEEDGSPKLRLQYLQTVLLDFFPAPDGSGLIRWPHVSINTMERVGDASVS